MGHPSPAHVDVYDPGDMITLRATFVSTDLVTPADPSTMLFLIRDPYGNVGSFMFGAAGASIVRDGAGAYRRDHQIPLAATAAGVWNYLGVGTGGVQAAQPWQFAVASSHIL